MKTLEFQKNKELLEENKGVITLNSKVEIYFCFKLLIQNFPVLL